MLPLSLLKTAENHPMLIEMKNGDTYNGRLVSCNMFMNICLRDVICTSKDGDRFWKLPECYIRGNSIKYLRIPDEIIDLVSEEEQRDRKAAFRVNTSAGRGGRTAGRIGGGRSDSTGSGGRTSGGGGGRGGDSSGRSGGGRGGDTGGRGRGGRSYGSGRNDTGGRGGESNNNSGRSYGGGRSGGYSNSSSSGRGGGRGRQ